MAPGPDEGAPAARSGDAKDAQRISFSHSAGKTSAVDVVRLSELRGRELDHSVFDPTLLDFHLLQFVVAGTGRHWSDFEPIDLEAGEVLHVRPKQVHSFDPHSGHEALLLFFTPDALLESHIPEPLRWQPNTVLRPDPQDFEITCELMNVQASLDTKAREIDAGRVGPHLLGAILGAIAGVVSARLGVADVPDQRAESLVLEFEQLLDDYHAACRNLSWYASQLRSTTRGLSRACHRARHLPPKRMIDLRVVLEAKRRLTTSTATVEAIGLSLGFTEATNFVKFFRRIAGTTPEAFRTLAR